MQLRGENEAECSQATCRVRKHLLLSNANVESNMLPGTDRSDMTASTAESSLCRGCFDLATVLQATGVQERHMMCQGFPNKEMPHRPFCGEKPVQLFLVLSFYISLLQFFIR